MNTPDQRAFEADIEGADFQIGASKGMWGLAEANQLPDDLVWPKIVLWVASAEREHAPPRFYLLLDLDNYRAVAPTGAFWDLDAKVALPTTMWPKGKPGSRTAKVFRTDWDNAVALYHPYDRRASGSHPNWKHEQPHLVWNSMHTIADYLTEIHGLLNSRNYIGI